MRSQVKGHCSILFLCIGNSVRFIPAKAIFKIRGRPNFTAYNIGRTMPPADYRYFHSDLLSKNSVRLETGLLTSSSHLVAWVAWLGCGLRLCLLIPVRLPQGLFFPMPRIHHGYAHEDDGQRSNR